MPKKHVEYIEIKLHRNRLGHMLVPVHIGRKRFDFILDTGATATCIDASIAGLKGFGKARKKKPDAQGLGGSIYAEIFKVDNLSIGDIEITNFHVACLDLTPVKQTYAKKKTKSFHGILGVDVLTIFDAVIDWGERVLKLRVKG